MGRVSKGIKCSVIDCEELSVRSISAAKVKPTGLNVVEARRLYLCENHYKAWKKKNRNQRRVEKWRWRV